MGLAVAHDALPGDGFGVRQLVVALHQRRLARARALPPPAQSPLTLTSARGLAALA